MSVIARKTAKCKFGKEKAAGGSDCLQLWMEKKQV